MVTHNATKYKTMGGKGFPQSSFTLHIRDHSLGNEYRLCSHNGDNITSPTFSHFISSVHHSMCYMGVGSIYTQKHWNDSQLSLTNKYRYNGTNKIMESINDRQ
jgi:hypothetical protein